MSEHGHGGGHGDGRGGHGHGPHGDGGRPDLSLRVEALEKLLAEKGFLDPAQVDAIVRHYEEDVGPLNGAAVVAEVLLVVQFLVGSVLWLQGMQAGPRPWIHILYGTVAIITLPAAYSYFGKLEDSKVQALAMTVACAFLWGIVQRAAQVITLQVPY